MKKGKVFYLTLFYLFSISSIYSQNFNRIIEMKNTRMNGQDILSLQNRLLSLRFYEVGSADGYYGPLTMEVIKSIQFFSGFESDGKVNRSLWDFIFNDRNTSILQNISTILLYNPMRLTKTRDLLYSDAPIDVHSEAFVYFDPTERKAKILEYYAGNPHTQTMMTCYYINDNYYFIKYIFNFPSNDFSRTEKEEKMYLSIENNIFEIVNGVMTRSDYSRNRQIIEHINHIVNKFLIEYIWSRK